MRTVPTTLYRFSRVIIVFAITLALTASVAAAAEPVTVRTEVMVSGTGELPVTVASFEVGDEGGHGRLSVEWAMDTGAWFPTGTMRLIAPDALASGAMFPVSLFQATPVVGHHYEVTTSYNPAVGVISVRLRDLADNKTVATKAVMLSPYEGDVAVVMDDTVPHAVFPVYEPVDMKWNIGSVDAGTFIPQDLFQDEAVAVRVDAFGLRSGEFRISIRGDLLQTVLVTQYDPYSHTFMMPLTADLPFGTHDLTLDYVDDTGTIRWSDSKRITVGKLNVAIRDFVRYDDDNRFEAVVTLQSSPPMPDVTVHLDTTTRRLMWDGTKRNYESTAHSIVTETICDGCYVSGEGITVPISGGLPTDEGTYYVDFDVHVQSDVAVGISKNPHYIAVYDKPVINTNESFTVAVLPDTQLYTKFHPHIYLRQTEWIAMQAAQRNIAFALHLGDITEDNTPVQWRVAADAHSFLDGLVPYVLTVGNHDYAESGWVADRDTTLINRYFKPAQFPHMQGMMIDGKLENTYHVFNVGAYKFLIVALEFAPADEVLDWANDVVAAHPDHTVIVITHAYLHPRGTRLASGESAKTFPLGSNPNTTMNDGHDIWHKFAKYHPNILLVMSGHISSGSIPFQLATGVHGNRVFELLANYQNEADGGTGWMVLLDFHPTGEIDASVYSPYLDEVKITTNAYGFPSSLRMVPLR